MNFYKKIALIFTTLFLISCENYYSSNIVNNSDHEIIVRVKMDQNAIQKQRAEYLKKGLLVNEKIPQDYEIKIDSSESYEFAGRLHTRPDFLDIKEIEIYSGDTLILKCRKSQMQKIFSTELNPGTFDLVIE